MTINNFNKLKEEIKKCRDCRKLFGFEPNPVFCWNENSKIIQISQAPSQNVHITNKNFNDNSWKKLINNWYKISEDDFYNENNFYITSISHCYPWKNPKWWDNKPPIYCANKYLKQELNLVNSKLIILIWRFSANYFFPKKDFKELIFNNQEINWKLTIVLPHPSPLNQKWFKDNPDFEKQRLIEIRKIIQETLKN